MTLIWRKASASSGNGNCLEVGKIDEGDSDVLIRDSKNPRGPKLYFTRAEWAAFKDGVRKGEFD